MGNLSIALFILATVFVSACSSGGSQQAAEPESDSVPSGATAEPAPSADSTETPLWMSAELKDVATGDAFAIAGFEKPVLIESFAVWCPVCTRQQQESKKLEEATDSIVSVSINTDPNEDESKVKAHVERNGFDWYYAVASTDVTNSLIDSFGLSITNVPLAPMVVVCPDKSAHRLRNGVKSASELQSTVTDLCGA